MGIVFDVISGNNVRLSNNDFNRLNIILVQDSCPLKPEIARFPLKAVVFLIEMFHFTSYSGEHNTLIAEETYSSAPGYDKP